MEKYWVANFDFEECLRYGLRNKIWLMQYQYSDSHGNVFQGDRPSSVTTNWRQVKEVQAGDFLISYLSRKRNPNSNGFFAVGRVIAPRKKPDQIGTIEDYVRNKRSHEFNKGIIHYTDAPVLYEDFNDKWRPNEDSLSRYAQRIDVESWKFICEAGVPWLTQIKVGPSQQQRAIFRIKKSWFGKIVTLLKDAAPTAGGRASGRSSVKEERSATYASEKAHSKGQGYQLDSKLRKALEDWAMRAATAYFKSLGYKVVDVSAQRPYDLECAKGNVKVFVEVKGTQSTGESVFLTAGEISYALKHSDNMALFILHSIAVDHKGATSGGVRKVFFPWVMKQEDLFPMAYKYHVGG